MPNIVLTRIDERLIHGQVATQWSGVVGANLLLVANDKVATDTFRQGLMDMAAPSYAQTRYWTIEKTINTIHKAADRQMIFIICDILIIAFKEVDNMQESSISEKIKELRTDLKMNQKNFSAAIGIRQSTLSSYENGVVTPSNDVLLTIAQKFHVSLDWLFGLSENKVQISTLSDILWVLLQMNESNELRYELDINNKLPGDIETETQKWYAGLRFYGNDPEHSLNADMCNFLADLQENRESLESYFTGKDMFDMWKKQTLEYYTSKPVTHKEIEELDFETRIRKRDELLAQKFSNNEQK